MRRSIARPVVLLVGALLLGGYGAPFAAAPGAPLLADAGSSVVAFDGAPIALLGRAFNAQGAVAFAWSFQGSTARFTDATAAATTFDTAGLPAGDIVLDLTVTDGSGSASDTVRERIATTTTLVQATVDVMPGIPDEIFPGSGDVDGQTRDFPFTVAAGTTLLQGTLDWGNGLNDLDFELLSPGGGSATGNQGATSAKPEHAQIVNPATGAWAARVAAFLNGPDTYTLTVKSIPPAVTVPEARANGPYAYGAADVQALNGAVLGSAATGAWDLDLDGQYETPGNQATATFGAGTHTVAFKVTDAAGFESRSETTVTIAPRALRLECGGDATRPFWAMEFSASGGTCWMHGGHHTFFLGGETFAIHTGSTGLLVSVEQQFSPPTEFDGTDLLTTLNMVETSLDGQTWTGASVARYRFLNDPLTEPIGLEERQLISFDLVPGGAPFRYIRFQEPRSALQGLSGFLDASSLNLLVEAVAPAPTPTLAHQTKALSCADGDILEDFFAAHPCFFGGIDRFDSPSILHTYVAGDGARVERLTGVVGALPWRTDDWFLPLLPASAQVTGTRVFVQTSVNGIAWENVGDPVAVTYGVPANFDILIAGGRDARFVRLVPDVHPEFAHPEEDAALHHLEAFLTTSALTIEGDLPV